MNARTFVLCSLAFGFATVEVAAMPTSVPKAGSALVASLPTSTAKNAARFDISIGACGKTKGAAAGACAVTVTLKGGGAKGARRMEWTAPTGSIVAQGEHGVAIGDDADTAMALSWRLVELKRGLHGVMVSQQTGSDRVKRRHEVIVNFKGKLLYTLEVTEPRGAATFSALTSVDMDNDGYGELVVIQSQAPDAEQADSWSVDVYAWRADQKRVVKVPSWRPTIQAGLVGMFNTLADAREFAANKCLHEFLVVDNKSATLLADGMFAVAYLAATVTDAELALEAVKACDESLVGAVKAVTPGLAVAQP